MIRGGWRRCVYDLIVGDRRAVADNGAVASYEHFARWYDELMGDADADPLGNVARIRGYLARHLPGARSLLELGCGSGTIMAGLDLPRMTGLDRSPGMLARARAKVPRARFVQGDIASFELDERFDALICVFDTLNHLERFELWSALFERAAAHLQGGGLLAFDVNTLGQLRRLAAAAPWTRELSGATVTQAVDWLGGPRFAWRVRICERLGDGRTVRRDERIGELGVPLAALDAALAPWFEPLERSDGAGGDPDDESARAYFAYRRREAR